MLITINQSGWNYIRTAKEEVCHITNACCHSSLGYQMYQNFHQFNQYTCYRSHCKRTDQCWNLREIQLIKGRCQKWQRYLKIHQHTCHST